MVPSPSWLGLFYLISEVGLSLFKRAKSSTTNVDEDSIRMLWFMIIASIAAAAIVVARVPTTQSRVLVELRSWWFAIYVAGIVLRWWAIVHLGRFFTVNLAIATDHHVVDTGPYRLIRHPSYTGALMAFTGFGLSVGNWLAFLVAVVPIAAAFLRRITIEEQALRRGLGEPYEAYTRRTRRLVPYIY